MKPAHDPTNRNCSCATCMYKSGSENPSVRRIIAEGSRIDKLYFGKYIPLRERKLLDKLVRTRAVYDDIRNQLISDSEASMKEKPNLRPRRHQARNRDLKGRRSSAILEIVDMVDKGRVSGPTTPSECCDCCICGSKTIHAHHQHREMQRHKHGHGRGREAAEVMSRTSVMIKRKMRDAKRGIVSQSRDYAHRISRTSTMLRQLRESKRGAHRSHNIAQTLSRTSIMIKQKMGAAKRKVRSGAKSIMSEPCTCTTRLGGAMKRESQEVARRFRPRVQLGEQTMFEGVLSRKYFKSGPRPEDTQIVKKKQKKGKILRESYQKIRKSKARLVETLGEGAKRVKESKTKIKEHIEAEARKSLEKIKDAKQKIGEAIRKSLQEPGFPIRKDSLVKYKEKIIAGGGQLSDYECQHECIPGECYPEDCFKIIKLRRVRIEKSGKKNEGKIDTPKNVGMTSSGSDMAVQVQQRKVVEKTETDKEHKRVAKIETDKKQTKENRKKGTLTEPRISIDIGTKKKSTEGKTENKVKDKSAKVKSVPSQTIPQVAPGQKPELKKNQQKQQEERKTSVVLKTKQVKGALNKIEHTPTKGQKAFKENSAFSFSFKGNGPNKPASRQIHVQKKERALRTKAKKASLGQGSQTILQHSKRNAQIGSHALKRCFCTLKLKGKGYKPKPTPPISITKETLSQTNKLNQPNLPQNVQTKSVKRRHRGASPRKETKSVSKLASRSVSSSSKSVTARAPQEIQKHQPKQTSRPNSELSSTKPVYEGDQTQVDQGEQKQAVRISSSFSFSIEFHKDNPSDGTFEPLNETATDGRKQNKSTRNKKHLRNKQSQISSTTVKSKYTLTKHGLKRCFCTLKLGQPNKKYKKKIKPVSRSTGSTTSQQTIQYGVISINKAVATDKKKKYHLLPYECEPGVCVPGKCDPYACLELINRRQMHNKSSNTDMNRLHVRHSNTNHRRTKSTSSFTSRSMPNQAKMVNSSMRVAERRHKDKGKAIESIKTSQSSPNRQIVRIRSSFSFNIEFYKDKPTVETDVIDIPIKSAAPSTEKVKRSRLNDRGYQGKKNKKRQQSTSMLVKKKNRGSFIAPMKRCFCTLKLQTKDQKQKKQIENTSIGTETPIENAVQFKNVMVSKGTKTKEKYGYALEPYECEPGVCVPGKCDPYECLKLIQMRQLKESGTTTDKAKMKSATSVTQRKKFRSKGALMRSKLKGQGLSTISQKIKEMPKNYQQYEQKPHRQVVRIGSTFSFDIEFRKDRHQFSPVKEITPSEITTPRLTRKIKHKAAKTGDTLYSHHVTQASLMKADKAAGIRPMLKRCFCTLKLQGNQNKKIKPPKVITVSRVTVTETRIKSHKNLITNVLSSVTKGLELPTDKTRDGNWANTLYNFETSSETFSKSSIVFRYKEMKSYFCNNNLESVNSKTISRNILKNSLLNIFAQPNFLRPTHAKVNQNYAYSENCIICCRNKEKRYLRKRKRFLKYKNSCLKSQKSSILSEPCTHHPLISPIKRQNYFTMNMQIPERKIKYKLKPYECEPGVCVPDECDPSECQKLIMKRLMKNASKMSGTNVRSKSMSSSTEQSTGSSKKIQSRQYRAKAKKVPASKPAGGMSFKTMPSKNHKQAVRVGSSFSFNIEFSKDRAGPAPEYTPRPTITAYKPSKPVRKQIKAQGTKVRGLHYRDHDSQSATASVNKGSGMKPIMQRCFCTLKLQKKGKNQRIQQKKIAQKAFERGTATPPNATKEFIASRTMINTGQNTVRKLLPYECEPLICVPGECDPYECLERIEKRNKRLKHFGTEAMNYKTSAGSMTGRNQYRTQGKQIQSKLKNKQTRSRGSTETKSSRVEKYQNRPSKQAVRIGSSFSFNVEFFKENSQSQPAPIQIERPSKPSVERVPMEEKVKKKKLKGRGSQDRKFVHDKDSQIENMATQGKSTMTASIIKRCFCTKNLYKKQKYAAVKKNTIDNKASQSKNKQPFLERCFCVMGKFKRGRKPKQPVIYAHAGTETEALNEPTHKDKKNVTRRLKSPTHELEPYECEPGICIPGECNPYECEKLIKARNIKLQTRQAFTDRPKTKSTSSNFSSQTSKARRTQSNFKTSSSTTKPRPSMVVREAQPVRHLSSDRQVVRIGSNFSFSVEFYKDRSPNTDEVQAAARVVRHKPHREPKKKAIKTAKVDNKTQDRGSRRAIKTFDQESQAYKAKMQDRGIAPKIKRCFCTLKLQKNKKQNLKAATHGTETMKEIPTLQTRGIGTGRHWKLKPYECEPGVCVPYQCDPYECEKLIKQRLLKETAVMTTGNEKRFGYKLLPYECEPGVCVPGQCDPYECDKRIQLRNMKQKDSGTATRKYRGRSVSSDIRSTTSSKAKRVQYKNRGRRRKRSQSVSSKPPRVRKSLDTSTRQSVRIGSGFSFDVEFYKDKSNNDADVRVIPYKRKVKPTSSMTSSAIQRLPATKGRKVQYRRGVRDTDSQMYGEKMRNTGVNPFLKRCFCTLKLQKSGDMSSKPKIISRAARDRSVYLATLLPYECEPGVCIPGQCDPYECQKRIQRRLMRSQRTGTGRTSQDSSTSSTAGANHRASACQSGKCPDKQKYQKGTNAKAMEGYETARPVSSSSSSRQAVRIGSSFKFDVEFYKDTSPKFESRQRESHVELKKRMHDIKTKSQQRKARSRSVTSSNIRRQHSQMQTGSRTESKSTGFGPRLKRCFCTLALHKKKTPLETRNISTFRNDDLSDLYAFSRNVGVGTRKKYPHLKTYECEPGVCVPGSCDPYECYERIKRRMRDSGTATVSPSKKYASSITPKNAKYRSANTQYTKGKLRRERPTMANFKERVPRPSGVSRTSGDNGRQAVRIGSNFSFSVEFYKDRPSVKIPKNVYKITNLESRPSKQKIGNSTKVSSTPKNYKSRPVYASKSGNNQECQSDCIRNKTRGTTMGAFLKRCFCTLNLHKNNKLAEKQKNRPPGSQKPNQKQKPPELYKAAMVQTRDKYTYRNKRYSLKPYECEPNVCIPGECNPYECEERIRRRNIRRQSRRIGTHRRSSQVSVGSMASKFVPRSSRRVQSRERRARYASRPSQATKLVEEPRFAHMFEEMRTGVKLGSNVSFNVEFYKDKSQTSPTYENQRYEDYRPKKIKDKQHGANRKSTFSESGPKSKQRGTGDKCNSRTCESQASGAAMVDKGAGMNRMLKRCFCTLKLHKNFPKDIAVNRVAIEDPNPIFRPREKPRKSQPQPILKTKFNGDNYLKKYYEPVYNNYRKNKIAQDNNTLIQSHSVKESKDKCKEMTTIYPYIPNKYNKNASHTVLLRDMESHVVSSRKYRSLSKRRTWFRTLSPSSGRDRQEKLRENENAKLSNNELSKSISKSSRMQNIKSFFHRLLPNFLSKKRKLDNNDTITENNMNKSKNINFHNQIIAKARKEDILKPSKSDRQPNSISKNITTPKKTKSLKATKTPENNRRYTDYANHCLSRKQYSRYQSGDYTQTQLNLTRGRIQRTVICPGRNDTYCKVIKNPKNMNAKSPYESNKIVQMALVQKKDNNTKVKSVSTVTNTNKKIKSNSRGVVTDTYEKKNGLLNQCMCYLSKSRSMKSTRSVKNIKGIKSTKSNKISKDNRSTNKMIDEDLCPCPRKGKKIQLSSGDIPVQPLKGKGFKEIEHKADATGKPTKKGKKVAFDEASINNKEISKKHKKASGDAPATDDGPDKSKNINTIAGISKSKSAKKFKDQKSPEAKNQKDQIPPSKEKPKDQKPPGIDKSKPTKKAQKTKEPYKKSRKGKFYGAKITIKAKGDLKSPKKVKKEKYESKKPCVCGTLICDKETSKMQKVKKIKGLTAKVPCVCGSSLCAKESKRQRKERARIEKAKHDLICSCHEELERQKELARRKVENEKKRLIQLERVRKRFKEEDEKRKKLRMKEDREQEKQLRKLKQSPDGALAAESFLDVLKLGVTASLDVLRCGQRALLHPKHTALSMKELISNPDRAMSSIASTLSQSGVVSTVRRVRRRCAAMRRVQRIKNKLEGNPVTRYLMYMCSKDAKKRIGAKAKRRMRKREPIDFECSLFMSSLRKRPCLAVYYSCPWFYPHCLSMLNLWKQFTDVMLFLIAVTVWSPCILLMEICRAGVCCFFCTG